MDNLKDNLKKEDYSKATYSKFKEAAYGDKGIIRNNYDATTLEARTAVVKQYDNDDDKGLLVNLAKRSTEMEEAHNESMRVPENRYRKLLLGLQDWILKGKSKTPKDYVTGDRFHDTPSEINDNEKTSDRIYTGKRNYYKNADYIRDEKLMEPKAFKKKYKNELNNPYIKRIYKSLTDREAALRENIGNRRKISKAISEDRQTLKEAMLSFNGLNHTGRTDNTVSPKREFNLPTLKNRTYVKGLLTHHLDEITDQDMRLDKITINDRIGEKSRILSLLERGYHESEIARTIGISQAAVSQRINRVLDKLIA